MAFNSYTDFHGDSLFIQIVANTKLEHTRARVWSISAKGPGLFAILPDARRFSHTGGPMFEVLNLGTNSFDIVDQSLTLIGTVAVGEACEVVLLDNSIANGDWRTDCSAFNFPDSSTAGGPGGTSAVDPGVPQSGLTGAPA